MRVFLPIGQPPQTGSRPFPPGDRRLETTSLQNQASLSIQNSLERKDRHRGGAPALTEAAAHTLSAIRFGLSEPAGVGLSPESVAERTIR